MKKNNIIFIVILSIIILSIIFFSFRDGEKTSLEIQQPNNLKQDGVIATANVIEITVQGFIPSTLEIKQGDTVTFVNKDSNPHWPASAMHPTHTTYPGSDIEKCGTSEENNTFDSCKGIAQGEEYKFIFNEKGSWSYHDHLIAGLRGKIIVN